MHHGNRFTQTVNTIPLYQPYEYITAVKWIYADQVLIGSSTGQAYLLNPTSDDAQHRVVTLCKQGMSGPLGFVKLLYATPIPHASECVLPKTEESGPIVNISTVDGMVYVCSQHQVCIWTIVSQTEAQVMPVFIRGNRQKVLTPTTANCTHFSPKRNHPLYISACTRQYQEIHAPMQNSDNGHPNVSAKHDIQGSKANTACHFPVRRSWCY